MEGNKAIDLWILTKISILKAIHNEKLGHRKKQTPVNPH